MKFLNDFKNVFAIVGVVSIIFWTCASESTSDTTNVNPPQLTEGYGKYQVSTISVESGNFASLVILNTETGIMKSYYRVTGTSQNYTAGEWVEGYPAHPGSGNLTVNH
jgi:hypothetical protein